MQGIPHNSGRLSIVQILRGISAFIVVWHHFVGQNLSALDVGVFKFTDVDGMFGVRVFFVISGFVLPYSLWKGGYIFADFGRFLLKRIVRLDPPYIVSIAIALATGYLATLFPSSHAAFSVSPLQLVLHLGYLNAFWGMPWIQPVYWTLAIEFQYYLILGFVFPLLRATSRLSFATFVVLCAVSQCLIFKLAFLPMHWPFFLMGIVAFRFKAQLIRPAEALGWLLLFAGWAVLTSGFYTGYEVLPGVAGAAAALCIMYVTYHNRVLTFLGDISYSLYLIHVPIGGRIVNLGSRYAAGPVSALMVALFAACVSIAAAYAMYRWVENPAQHFAGKIKYESRKSVPAMQLSFTDKSA